ncbi:alkaline phosphatase D family protein [Polymorphospora sp. NPDC051019]|uniref:alkaline phosphatase D family protein n=1 Tax=Polymorphospora sp. NPDC051019 TaxID=3155725 RepID=UPI0034279003
MPSATAELLIGPLLRRVVGTRATVWVETSGPGTVSVRTPDGAGGSAATFTAFDHHYALVVVDGLAPDAVTPYEVFIDDERVWPLPDSPYPASVIRTRRRDGDDAGAVRLIFGSCRETTQHSTTRRLRPDALDAYARRLMTRGPDSPERPDLMVLLGDQVYADNTSPKVRQLLRGRRNRPAGAPADQVVSYDEYTKLYLESWRDPEIRWLLATVPSVMIFDDHEVIDDWNTSRSWRDDVRREPWWAERIASGLASYWVYQHLGNLEPEEIATDPVYAAVVGADDATGVLREFGARVDAESDSSPPARGYRWSYRVDVGRTRIVVLDNRCSRVLDNGSRAMLPPDEWSWFVDQTHGDYDHLVVGASLPWLLPPGIHHLEAWNERLAGSARPRVAALSEKIRQVFDLEHWAAFHRSFDDLAELFARLGSGGRAAAPDRVGAGAGAGNAASGTAGPGTGGAGGAGEAAEAGGGTAGGQRVGAGPAYPPPASISVLGGDVHHSYVARAHFAVEVTTPVHQLTCSPIHNQVPAFMRPVMRLGWWRGPASAAGALARSAGLRRPVVGWRKLAGPYFGNAISTLLHEGRSARVTVEGTRKDGELRIVAQQALAAGGRMPG